MQPAADTAQAPTPVLRRRVQNRRDALEPARLAVLAHLAPWSLSDKARYRVELVLEETLLNAMLHGHPGEREVEPEGGGEGDSGGTHAIDLSVQVRGGAVCLCFEDDGIAFDPLAAVPRPQPASLTQAEPGGLGLLLVRRLSRSVQYERHEGRNTLRIEVALG